MERIPECSSENSLLVTFSPLISYHFTDKSTDAFKKFTFKDYITFITLTLSQTSPGFNVSAIQLL